MGTPKVTATERQDAIRRLRDRLTPGDTVFCILKHVSSSGMSRRIDFVIPDTKEGIENISWLVARAVNLKRHDDGSLKVQGVGEDLGAAVVHELGCCLFPDGFTHTVRTSRLRAEVGTFDKNGGFALLSRWL